MKSLEYFSAFWLPIKLEILPCIKGWFSNAKKLWPSPPIRAKIDENDKLKITKLYR